MRGGTLALTYVEIAGFRNLASVKLAPVSQGINFFYGENGSGKTSFLESIYFLSRGRSFRSSNINHFVLKSAEKLSIFVQLLLFEKHSISLGLERKIDEESIAYVGDKKAKSRSELLQRLPIQLINSHSHSLVDSSPAFRRKYIDWGAFYLINNFMPTWQRYTRALQQRNAALSAKVSAKELQVWTQELLESANLLHQLRMEYINSLLPRLSSVIEQIFTISQVELDYFPGWAQGSNYQEILANNFERDFQLGYTQSGPHKADLKIKINRTGAKDTLSRGQQKLFVCAMIVAQGELLNQVTNRRPIYLIDDLPAELDTHNRRKLIALIAKQNAQIFLTSCDREIVNDLTRENVPIKMFHVEHGGITEQDMPIGVN